MAAQGLIVLDIGILMGSQSQTIFMEQLDLYPGARHLFDVAEQIPCECGREACPRETFQFILQEACGKDKELAAKFIERSQSIRTPADIKELIHDFFHDRETESQSKSLLERLIGGHFRGRVIPLVAIPSLEPEAPADNLGDDEPEHSGPRKE